MKPNRIALLAAALALFAQGATAASHIPRRHLPRVAPVTRPHIPRRHQRKAGRRGGGSPRRPGAAPAPAAG